MVQGTLHARELTREGIDLNTEESWLTRKQAGQPCDRKGEEAFGEHQPLLGR